MAKNSARKKNAVTANTRTTVSCSESMSSTRPAPVVAETIGGTTARPQAGTGWVAPFSMSRRATRKVVNRPMRVPNSQRVAATAMAQSAAVDSAKPAR